MLFNRIAGPNSSPGVYNGVLIARLNADNTVAQLEIALRDFLSDVENAYWDLYYAYQDLDVKRSARDRTLNTYQLLQARGTGGLVGAEADKLAQAREQYFRMEQEVQNALAGRLVVGTRSFNGSGGGTFQGSGGVYVNERRLRMVMGLPINDGRLIRTVSEPAVAPISYDWNSLASNAVSRRTELRRQRLNVDRRRYEVLASKNFLMPRLDAIGRYRYRGLADEYLGNEIDDSGSIIDSDTHEFLMGLTLSYPVGARQAAAAVRNAQLRYSRERALLNELQRQVIYGVSNALAESDRSYAVLRTAMNRENAARQQYELLVNEAKKSFGEFNFNALLDSEQRYADASNAANRARVQYVLATKNLNFETGGLLEYYNIHLADSSPTNITPRRHRNTHSVLAKSSSENAQVAGSQSSASAGALVDAAVNHQSSLGPTASVSDEAWLINETQMDEIFEQELSAVEDQTGESVREVQPIPESFLDAEVSSPSDMDLRRSASTKSQGELQRQ